MANIGDQLLQPEAGWKRIDDTDDLIHYDECAREVIDSVHHNGSVHAILKGKKGAKIKFKFTGTKIRIIGTSDAHFENQRITIDNIQYDLNQKPLSGNNLHICLQFEKLDLLEGIHYVEIEIINLTTDSSFKYENRFDCIDINSDGYLLPELSREYEFPIAVIEEDEVAGYASSLINGEEQLLITPLGNLHLTDGNKSYIEVGVSKAKYQELENRIIALEALMGTRE